MALTPWDLIASTPDKSYRVFHVRVDRARSPRTGQTHDFFVLESRPWVNVIPLTPDRQVVMIRQYRHGIREMTLEIPGGLVEGCDDPEQAATRELAEESGYRPGQMIPLGWVHPNPAIQNNRCYTFLATDVVAAGLQQQEEKEDIEVVLHPLGEVPRLIRTGAISHSLVVAAFYRLFIEHLEWGR